MPKSWCGWLNFLALQWFGVRVVRAFEASYEYTCTSESGEQKDIRQRAIAPGPLAWWGVCFVLPLTGWWGRYLPEAPRCYRLWERKNA